MFIIKEKISLLLYQKKEKSYKNFAKYIHKITVEMNKSVKPISFLPKNTSINALFTLQNVKPTFQPDEKVYRLYTPFEKRSMLRYKSSIQLGKISALIRFEI